MSKLKKVKRCLPHDIVPLPHWTKRLKTTKKFGLNAPPSSPSSITKSTNVAHWKFFMTLSLRWSSKYLSPCRRGCSAHTMLWALFTRVHVDSESKNGGNEDGTPDRDHEQKKSHKGSFCALKLFVSHTEVDLRRSHLDLIEGAFSTDGFVASRLPTIFGTHYA